MTIQSEQKIKLTALLRIEETEIFLAGLYEEAGKIGLIKYKKQPKQ